MDPQESKRHITPNRIKQEPPNSEDDLSSLRARRPLKFIRRALESPGDLGQVFKQEQVFPGLSGEARRSWLDLGMACLKTAMSGGIAVRVHSSNPRGVWLSCPDMPMVNNATRELAGNKHLPLIFNFHAMISMSGGNYNSTFVELDGKPEKIAEYAAELVEYLNVLSMAIKSFEPMKEKIGVLTIALPPDAAGYRLAETLQWLLGRAEEPRANDIRFRLLDIVRVPITDDGHLLFGERSLSGACNLSGNNLSRQLRLHAWTAAQEFLKHQPNNDYFAGWSNGPVQLLRFPPYAIVIPEVGPDRRINAVSVVVGAFTESSQGATPDTLPYVAEKIVRARALIEDRQEGLGTSPEQMMRSFRKDFLRRASEQEVARAYLNCLTAQREKACHLFVGSDLYAQSMFVMAAFPDKMRTEDSSLIVEKLVLKEFGVDSISPRKLKVFSADGLAVVYLDIPFASVKHQKPDLAALEKLLQERIEPASSRIGNFIKTLADPDLTARWKEIKGTLPKEYLNRTAPEQVVDDLRYLSQVGPDDPVRLVHGSKQKAEGEAAAGDVLSLYLYGSDYSLTRIVDLCREAACEVIGLEAYQIPSNRRILRLQVRAFPTAEGAES